MKKWVIPILILLISLLIPEAKAAEVPFREGDRIVIYAPESSKALSAAQSSNYNLAVDVALEGDALTGYGETEVWTVIQSEDGWQFTNNGQYLSMAASYSYLKLDEVHDTWTVEASGEHFTFLNQGRSQLICLNSRRGQWNACTPASADRSGETVLAVYVLPREEPEPVPDAGIYFGQLHSHSALSDGIFTPAELYGKAMAAGLDFFAVTDHSHSFDHHEQATLSDGSASADWISGQEIAKNATSEDFLALFAFEMTWNQGQGHMNTFFTEGFASREREQFQAWDNGMETYISQLPEDSISQFNHPGPEFGNFKNFSPYSPEADARISLIEISEDLTFYFQALDAGWHLSPTLSGDAHSFDPAGRTAVLADSLTAESLRDALSNRRTYATTDEDLQIHFTLDGHEMGSILPRTDDPHQVTFEIQLHDPSGDNLGLAELLSEGETLAQCQLNGAGGQLSFTVPANRNYYLLRITQPDGDWAVTAPIWLDEREDWGIRSLEPEAPIVTAGENQDFSVELYNEEQEDLEISTIALSIEGVEYSIDGHSLSCLDTSCVEFTHRFPVDGVYTLTASLRGTLAGQAVSQHFSREVVVMPEDLVEDVILDESHGCGQSAADFLIFCAGQDVSVRHLTSPATKDLLANCRLLIIPAPETDFTLDACLQVADFVKSGGSVLLCGAGASVNPQAADRLNALLTLIGTTGRFRADDARDEVNNSGAPELLRATDFASSLWTQSLESGQFFVQNLGCSIDIGSGQWLVRGFATGNRAVLLAAEDTAYGGTVFLSGGNLLSDDALMMTGDPYALPTANLTILETLLGLIRDSQQIIPIAQLRQAEPGRIYLAEGRITAGTANPNTTFPDTIYLQDHTGGIAASGYTRHGLALGTQVRILGELIGGENPKLRILRLTELGKDSPVSPKSEEVPGSLLQVEGPVTEIRGNGTAVSQFTVGGVKVIVEDAIRSGSLGRNELARIVQEGNQVRAVGLGQLDGGQLTLRLRDCDEVRLLSGQSVPLPTEPDDFDDPAPDTPDDPDPDTTNPTGPDDPDDPGSGDPVDPDGENPPTGDHIGIFVLLLLISGAILLRRRRSHLSS